MSSSRRKVLAISSGGGHWVQLLRLRPAFDDCDVMYATVLRAYQADVEGASFTVIPDCNRSKKLHVLWSACVICLLLLRTRPDIVISTGAAPGYFALRIGRWLGARTIWVDSAANVQELSMSGRMVGPYADLWLTQWRHLAHAGRPGFLGSVL